MFGKPRDPVSSNATPEAREKRHPFRWVAFAFLLLGVLVYIPSVASLMFLVAALAICPIRRFRNTDFMRRLEEFVASFGVHKNLVFNIAAAILFVLGALVTPSKSTTTRSAPKASGSELVRVTDDIEYSYDPVDIFDYVTCSDPDAKLEVTDDVVAHKVGTQVVTFKISQGFLRNSEQDVELTVRDTCPPAIKLTEDSVQIMAGDRYDPSSNIKAVADPVDGELAQVQKEPTRKKGEVGLDRLYDEGWYLVSPADTDKVGEQEITVTAVDQHGNEATASFTLTVTDPFEGVHFTKKTSGLE